MCKQEETQNSSPFSGPWLRSSYLQNKYTWPLDVPLRRLLRPRAKQLSEVGEGNWGKLVEKELLGSQGCSQKFGSRKEHIRELRIWKLVVFNLAILLSEDFKRNPYRYWQWTKGSVPGDEASCNPLVPGEGQGKGSDRGSDRTSLLVVRVFVATLEEQKFKSNMNVQQLGGSIC